MKSGLDEFAKVVREKPKSTGLLMIYTKYQVPKKERHHWVRLWDMVAMDLGIKKCHPKALKNAGPGEAELKQKS